MKLGAKTGFPTSEPCSGPESLQAISLPGRGLAYNSKVAKTRPWFAGGTVRNGITGKCRRWLCFCTTTASCGGYAKIQVRAVRTAMHHALILLVWSLCTHQNFVPSSFDAHCCRITFSSRYMFSPTFPLSAHPYTACKRRTSTRVILLEWTRASQIDSHMSCAIMSARTQKKS